MKFLKSILKNDAAAAQFQKCVEKSELPLAVSGLSAVHRSVFVSLVGEKKRAIVITPDEATATVMLGDLVSLGVKSAVFPIRDFCFGDAAAVSKEYEYKRIDTLSKILDGEISVLIASAEAAAQLTVPPEVLKVNTIKLSAADTISPEALTKRLISAGYQSVLEVEGSGQFSRRGGILDIFPVNMSSPVRIEFWGDEIDSISEFDVASKRRTTTLNELNIIQAGEIVCGEELPEKLTKLFSKKLKTANAERLFKDIERLQHGISFPLDRYLPYIYNKATVFDYMTDALVFSVKFTDINENTNVFYKRFAEDYLLYSEGGFILPDSQYVLDKAELLNRFKNAVFLENFMRADYPVAVKTAITADYKSLPVWRGDISLLLEDTRALLNAGGKCVLLAGKQKAAQVIYEELLRRGVKAHLDFSGENEKLLGGITVVGGGLSGGFMLESSSFMCLTAGHIHSEEKHKKQKKNENAVGSLDELSEGDYVVHSIHGIGIFGGINKINNGGIIKDYIKINYAKTDVLYVPVTQLDLISKYIGAAESGTVRLNKLGSNEWHKTRARVKKAVKEMAKELTELYAKRQSVKGYAFAKDTELQAEFEARFPYAETADQIRSASEIKSDMEREIPMDRLLCGDVGFGKTEVALRAAFKCISEGKQCAVLVPTTILAFQHYNTVLRRFGDLPVNVKMLSRFVTPKEQKKIISDLAAGKIDMIIGTHRLISDDVRFRNLGLAIIDEEQRFGVAQKEKLKQNYPFVDVLTLSATPIPRTLNMAMSGLRDMSTIEEAPGERLPVQSYVLEYNKAVVIDAIRRELRRSGQVYYLYNRTEDIERKALLIKEALPEANIAVAHGKMSEDELSRVWQRLLDHEIDILVCTTIIETGVDVPNANTLIIEDADRLGLSQLHQLRGRVGRSPRRAYAYFCFKENRQLTDIAEKRLEAIRQFTEFGAGFKIAMRDLELRGAGNILGGEQHGNMEAVGYDMYIKLLNEAVNEQNGIEPVVEAECTVDLNISAHIPERYIESLPARLGVYKRIAAIENENQKMDVLDELIDRFGEPPKAVLGLIDIALLRRKAASLGIYEINELGDTFILKTEQINEHQIERIMNAFGKRVTLKAEEKPYYEVKALKGSSKAQFIEEIVSAL